MSYHKNNKRKGTNAERDLVNKFWASGWAAVRIAGSGSTQFPSPDIVVGKGHKKLAIEVKLTANNSKYFTKKEIKELNFFCEKFGAEPWVAVKFKGMPWFFFPVFDLKETNASFSVNTNYAKTYGLLFEDMIKNV